MPAPEFICQIDQLVDQLVYYLYAIPDEGSDRGGGVMVIRFYWPVFNLPYLLPPGGSP